MKKALIVRLSSLGDVVLTSVVFDPLLKAGYKPYLLTFKPYDEVFQDDDRVEVIPVSKENFFKEIEKIPKDFDLKVDLHGNLKTFFLRLFLGGKWRKYKKESIRRRLSVYFKHFRKPFFVPEAYVKSLQGIIEVKNPRPFIKVSEERIREFKDLYGKYVVIAPGARYKKKRYPYFKELSELFIKEGINVVIVGDEKDREISKDFPGVNLCGKLSLIDVLGVIGGAELFVGNDSGLLHCARAVKTKAIQIYGGTHPTLGFSLYPDEGKVVCKCLDCQPCDVHGKGVCKIGNYECLNIPPIKIFEYAINILNTKP
ncbi:glycosyltransferase family 9 protein [Aquifex aeolicus]|uniref:ADP-heptose:LPS heptosyltransferase n=1 Tax=Aquifex aeolicus (strain VF5) TaxID=224324 RepID=O67498_AQUAE|nr:glycosyltransferase family 9 protein [Aquifex aeolicus]AAC07461.1 ADP-heptose:LPS heptosyltransferase [Aquifex aeolicus VF5]